MSAEPVRLRASVIDDRQSDQLNQPYASTAGAREALPAAIDPLRTGCRESARLLSVGIGTAAKMRATSRVSLPRAVSRLWECATRLAPPRPMSPSGIPDRRRRAARPGGAGSAAVVPVVE